MSRDISHPIREAVAALLGCDVAAVMTSCTHIHAGPSALTGTEAIGWPVPPGYPALLMDRALEAANTAREGREPVTMRHADSELPGDVAVNRRGHPLAPRVTIVQFPPVVTVVNLGIHPTVTGPANLAVCTDFVGPFRRALTGITGIPTLFVQGCQGDVNPVPEFRDSGDPDAWAPIVERYAGRLASVTANAMHDTSACTGGITVDPSRTVDVRVGDTLLAQLSGSRASRSVELLEWSIGDVVVIAVPGEGFHAVEQALREARGQRLVLAGLSPEWHGYLPRPYTDGYEEGLSLGAPAVDTLVGTLAHPPTH
jgi:hypothetical protein